MSYQECIGYEGLLPESSTGIQHRDRSCPTHLPQKCFDGPIQANVRHMQGGNTMLLLVSGECLPKAGRGVLGNEYTRY